MLTTGSIPCLYHFCSPRSFPPVRMTKRTESVNSYQLSIFPRDLAIPSRIGEGWYWGEVSKIASTNFQLLSTFFIDKYFCIFHINKYIFKGFLE